MQTWAFGRTVRRWRDRVSPAAVGLPGGSRRRATGLRREELAALAVYDATWTLIAANAPVDALVGETSSFQGLERNALWRNFVGPANRMVHTPAELAALQAGQVADLGRTAARYPADLGLRRLVRELSAYSPRFVQLWDGDGRGAQLDQPKQKVVDHPLVGPITLDCDVFFVATDDVRLMIYTAEPGDGTGGTARAGGRSGDSAAGGVGPFNRVSEGCGMLGS